MSRPARVFVLYGRRKPRARGSSCWTAAENIDLCLSRHIMIMGAQGARVLRPTRISLGTTVAMSTDQSGDKWGSGGGSGTSGGSSGARSSSGRRLTAADLSKQTAADEKALALVRQKILQMRQCVAWHGRAPVC